MSAQEPLIHEPAAAGLWRRFVEDGAINHGQWMRACAEGGFVGECPCGDYLMPRRPEQVGSRRVDYSAVCRSGGCDKEVCAPGGRLRIRTTTRRTTRA